MNAAAENFAPPGSAYTLELEITPDITCASVLYTPPNGEPSILSSIATSDEGLETAPVIQPSGLDLDALALNGRLADLEKLTDRLESELALSRAATAATVPLLIAAHSALESTTVDAARIEERRDVLAQFAAAIGACNLAISARLALGPFPARNGGASDAEA